MAPAVRNVREMTERQGDRATEHDVTRAMIWKGDALMNGERDRDKDQREATEQDDKAPAKPQVSEQQKQGQSPFLRQMREVERQGVPEPGAVSPGPPPEPVRSGDFSAAPVRESEQGQGQGQGEER